MGKTGFTDDFKRNFLTGLAALFPMLITIFLLVWLYGQINRTIGHKTNNLCISVVARNEGIFQAVFKSAPKDVLSDREKRFEYADQHFPKSIGLFFGLAIVIVAIYLTGMFLRGFFGRKVISTVDRFFERFPVIKTIYPHARQVGNFLFGYSDRPRFSHVVGVEYPRRGIFSIGFLTGDGVRDVNERSDRELLSVFIPTSPAPLTGFVIQVPADEIIHVDMTIDEAFRYCVTAGMLLPPRQQLRAAGEAVRDVNGLPASHVEQALGEEDAAEPSET